MIVVHVAFTCAEDYVTRREPHRRAHIERLAGLRQAGALIAGGPAPDARSADLVYRLQQPSQLAPAIEEDPYWTAGAWTRYTPRSFAQFVEPWQLPEIVLDGSRRATIVEGRVADPDMAEFVLIELRGAGRLAFGGFFEGGDTFALCKTADGAEAVGWLEESGFWAKGGLRARPFLWVL
jgi:uncharacterized protein YciI